MILLICIFRPFTGMGTLSWVCGMGGGKVGFTGMNSGKEAERGVPVLFGKRQNCCGCSACYAICPVGAIKMKQNQAGFLYPVINKKKCIRCYQCLSVCAFKVDQAKKGYPVE